MESPQPLRVLVAFAEPVERDAASSELRAAGMVVVAACGSGSEALDVAAALLPDVCVLDEDMPADAIAAARPAAGLVVVARDRTEAGLARAIAAGAHAYVESASDPAQLAAAVVAVADGRVVYPQSLMKRLLGVLGRVAASRQRSDSRTLPEVVGSRDRCSIEMAAETARYEGKTADN